MDTSSPKLTPARPDLNPSRSPSPDIPKSQIGPDDAPQTIRGSRMLLRLLNNGRDFEAHETVHENLPCDEDSPGEEPRREGAAEGNTMGGPLLQHLATEALQAASIVKASPSLVASVPKKIPDRSTATRRCSIHEPPIDTQSELRSISHQRTPLPNEPQRQLLRGARALAGESKETLPSQSFPSPRSTLGKLQDLHPTRSSEQYLGRVTPGPSSIFPTSPVANLGHRFSLNTNVQSSPRSPPDGYRTPSPHSAPSASMNYHPKNGNHPRAPTEYSSSNAGETSNTDHSASTPATSTAINSTSITDRMSIDGITHPQPLSGSYTCTFTGCNAAPFQTQYLLNSHMIVHSSERPHYCPVKGCPRSEGGKGFKRKNEVIKHHLVHDSPGYICPFCPDNQHKYPRPDNLTRHVRSQHKDKDKDNPQLRNVLAQRPGGSNQTRKRHGPP